MKKRYYLTRRQKSFDGSCTVHAEMRELRRMKSDDEKDFTDFEKADLVEGASVLKEKSDRIKMAAIYDDEREIISILSKETNTSSIQELLSMQDERGQPCIFYALESRSKNALLVLLCHVKNTECVVAANGESVLHVATKMGDIDLLKSLMTEEFVEKLVNHVERENGRAPLHLAAIFNHVEIAKELLMHGANLDRGDIMGKTPIFMAAYKGHASMLEIFLKHGHESTEELMFDSSLFGKYYDNLLQVAVDSGDESTVHVCLAQDQDIVRRCLEEEIKHGNSGLIHSACKNGMETCLLKIVECMGHLEQIHFSRKDRLGFAPIHKAAVNNHHRLVRYIGSMSKSFVNQPTKYSQTALLLAAQRGHIKVVEELLNLKADFKTTDDSDRTVLHYAIDYPHILKMLLKKKDILQLLINAKEKDGYTPVHNAALKGLCESLRILLEYGADLNIFTNTSRSPLHCAVSSQCVDTVQLVLSNEPALINKADATGKTPLHTAASYGSVEVARRLLDNGALIVRDDNLYSALHIAAHKGHLAIVELIVTVNKGIIDWKNKYGRTALIAAASTGKSDVVKFLLDKEALITEDYEFFNCLDWCLIKNDKDTAMTMMLHSKWSKILTTTKHGSEGTMAKLVYKMPEVAHRVLSNSVTSRGHPDSKDHEKCYDFLCLQNSSDPDVKKADKVKPLTAIKTMIRTECYSCLCHPVCCRFLKAKWMDFGWKIHFASLLQYIIFLVTLNVYSFQIPSHEEARRNKDNNVSVNVSVNVKVAMVICLLFASLNMVKEVIQLILCRFMYFLDKVNYLECVMYVCVFIFAVPTDQKIAVKTSLQWQACSVALLLAWINLVLYLRRFASYGIYVLMMKRISGTLIKVLSLLIFFFVAFSAAFIPIMHDRQGFTNFGLSMLTNAVMTMGEFDFKQTFLGENTTYQYETFFWLRLLLLVVFIIIMPIILMNLLLALAIDDTSSIMQQAKLRKHIQTADMIITIERKRSVFSKLTGKPKLVPAFKEHPNKCTNIYKAMWEYLFYGTDFTFDEGTTMVYAKPTTNQSVEDKFVMMVDMMKEVQAQMAVLQEKVAELQNGASVKKDDHGHHRSGKTSQHAGTQFRGYSDSFGNEDDDESTKKRKLWIQANAGFSAGFSDDSTGVDPNDIVFMEAQDVKDEKDREKKENDPELKELKELHDKTLMEEYESVDSSEDGEEGGLGRRLTRRLFQVTEEEPDNMNNNFV